MLSSDGVSLVEFYAPWCGHCQSAKPEVEKAAKALKGLAKVAAVDMTAHQDVGTPYGIKGFPTFKLFVDGKPVDYNGERSATGIVDFVVSALGKAAKQRLSGGGGGGGGGTKQQQQQQKSESAKTNAGGSKGKSSGKVETVTDDTFDDMVLGSQDMVLISFTAPWCGHCKNLKPHWADAAAKLAGTGIRVMDLDATANEKVARRFQVQGFPTIKIFPPGPKQDSDAIDYNGPRDGTIAEYALEKFTEMGGSVKADVTEVTDQKTFQEACGAKCVLVFVPDLLESSAKERKALLETIEAQASQARHLPFLWVAANSQPEWEKSYGLTFGFPAVLLLREIDGAKVGFVHRGKMSATADFVKAPRGLSQAVKGGWPTILSVAKWDGKDAPKPKEDDDFDLGTRFVSAVVVTVGGKLTPAAADAFLKA